PSDRVSNKKALPTDRAPVTNILWRYGRVGQIKDLPRPTRAKRPNTAQASVVEFVVHKLVSGSTNLVIRQRVGRDYHRRPLRASHARQVAANAAFASSRVAAKP